MRIVAFVLSLLVLAEPALASDFPFRRFPCCMQPRHHHQFDGRSAHYPHAARSAKEAH